MGGTPDAKQSDRDPVAPETSRRGAAEKHQHIPQKSDLSEDTPVNESDFRALFENMAAASCIDEMIYRDGKAIDYRIIDINPSFEKILGVRREDTRGRLASEIYGTYDIPFLDIYARVAETGEPASFEAFFAPAGKYLHITASCPIRGRFSTVFTDVTERRKLEDAFHRQEEAQRILLNESPDPIFSLTSEGRYIYVNPAFAEGVGKPVADIIDHTMWDVFPKEEADKRFAALSRVFQSGQPFVFEVRVPRADADRYYVTTITPIRNLDGRVHMAICSSKEITDRKRQEDALKMAEERYRATVVEAPFPMIIHAEDGEVLFVNRTWTELTGYSFEDIPTIAEWTRKAYGVRQELVRKDIDRLYGLTGRISEGEYEISTVDGRKVVWDFSSAPLGKLADGRRTVISMAMDVTERNSAARKVMENERFVESILENIPNMIFVKDAKNLSFVRINRAGELLLGIDREEMLGKTDYDFFPVEQADFFVERDSAVLDALAVVDIPQERVESRTRGTRTVHTKKIPVVDNDGKPRYLLGISEDITDSIAAREALIESEARFRTLFDESTLGMAVAGPDFRFRQVNEAFCRFTGYTQEDLFGRTFMDITHEDHKISDLTASLALVEGKIPVYRTEKRYIRKDGITVWGSASISLVRASDGSALWFLATIEDITERKRIETERERAEAFSRQQQKLESIGTLASGVAHEINNPLNVIMNYGQLIHDDPGRIEKVRDFASHIVKESERVALIVRNLLSFARQDKESHSPAQIADIVERTLSLMRAVLRKDQITLTCDIPENMPQIKCRSQQIQQVLMNLITNARDAVNQKYLNGTGQKTIDIRSCVINIKDADWVRLTVEDNGSGIQPEVADKIFDPFFTTKPRDRGTGLGLSISFGIIQEHHGRLWFETEPDKGTRFHLDLPVDNGWETPNAESKQ